MSTTPATNSAYPPARWGEPAIVDHYTDTLTRMVNAADRPGLDSEGLDHLIDAVHAAAVAYEELDYLTHITPAGPLYELLERARNDAYESWQRLERAGLPLLRAWQRESLGYSDRELAH